MRVDSRSEITKYYEALVNRDPGFVGIFYVAVKTTGVFCISTCRARKPKIENVEFYTDLKEALKFGYRPCKICKPTENTFQLPAEISLALNIARENPTQKVTDYQLFKVGLQPEKIRRWFKRHYGITFQAYQRMIRINTAFQDLRNGENVTSSAFGSGYESLSGFSYSFKKITGSTPEKSKNKELILISRFNSPLGPMYTCSTTEGICLVEFTDRRMLETEFHDLQKRLNAKIIAGENEYLKQLKEELQDYFEGTRKTFTVNYIRPDRAFSYRFGMLLWKSHMGKQYRINSRQLL